jgi:ankyrin repeat protein
VKKEVIQKMFSFKSTFSSIGRIGLAAFILCAIARMPAAASDDLDRALLRASEAGDTLSMNRLLDRGANVNAMLDGDGSPLIAASRKGRLEAAALLLNRRADPNMQVPKDGSPLIVAAQGGFVELIALLLDRGAAIDQIVPGDENPLIQASASGRLEVVKLLVNRGANVNARAWAERTIDRPNGEWRTALTMARQGNHSEVVSFLLASGGHP